MFTFTTMPVCQRRFLLPILFLMAISGYLLLPPRFVLWKIKSPQEFDTSKRAEIGHRLRFMTFNTWNEGMNVEDGLRKIAKHISYVKPDFVALQEIRSTATMDRMINFLGSHWSYVIRKADYPSVAILTRHVILDSPSPYAETSVPSKIRVKLSDDFIVNVAFWAVHLNHLDYGPYTACHSLNKWAEETVRMESRLNVGETKRMENILTTANLKEFRMDLGGGDNELMVMAGDLNSPSHLDWVQSTKTNHCGLIYQWPVTKFIMNLELIDAFRHLYPDPEKVPGNTWRTVEKWKMNGDEQKIPEPQDRLDMVFYKSKRWIPVRAEVYYGNEIIQHVPKHGKNDWPSDHAGVLVDFEMKGRKVRT